MKHVLAFTLAIAPLNAPIAAEARSHLNGDEQLARLLEGRESGTPVQCILRIGDRKVIDKTAIIYRIGSTIYVNRTSNPAKLDSRDSFLTQSTNASTSKFCRGDIVKSFDDRGGIIWTDLGEFQEFVPYTRPTAASAD
jgi:hypothetical protein